jgi:GTP cyclohydrolase II
MNASAIIPILNKKKTLFKCYKINKKLYIVIIFGNIKSIDTVRIHDACHTSEIYNSVKCDCKDQFDNSLEYLKNKNGCIIYTPHEGRGIGLYKKILAYNLQYKGINTFDANIQIGENIDNRCYDELSYIFKDLNLYNRKLNLISNNPNKKNRLINCGLKIKNLIKLPSTINKFNYKYLFDKINITNHDICFTLKILFVVYFPNYLKTWRSIYNNKIVNSFIEKHHKVTVIHINKFSIDKVKLNTTIIIWDLPAIIKCFDKFLSNTTFFQLVIVHNLFSDIYYNENWIQRLNMDKNIILDIEKKVFIKTDIILTTSERTKKKILEKYDKDSILFPQSQDCIDKLSISNIDEKIMVEKPSLGIDVKKNFKISITKDNIIVCIGSIEDRKNQLSLIKHLNDFKDKNWKCYLIYKNYDINYFVKLCNEINSNDLSNKIILLNNDDDIADILQKTSIHINMTKYESFGMAINDTLLLGIPTIFVDENCDLDLKSSFTINNNWNKFFELYFNDKINFNLNNNSQPSWEDIVNNIYNCIINLHKMKYLNQK